ncbi:MAG: hypothetical protein ACRD2B_02670 [Terriglobia bacterium]
MIKRSHPWLVASMGVTLALGGAAVGRAQQQNSQQSSSSQSQAAPPSSNQAAPAPSLERRPATAPAPPAVNAEETQAYKAIQEELNPDKQLQLVEDFEKKYPNSPLLSDAYFFGASASEQKNNVAGALSYGQKSLKLRPDNLRSLILVASLLPLPQALQGTEQQKEQQLIQSESDANRALQLLTQLQKEPNLSADQFQKAKEQITAQLHAALGMAHLETATLAPGPPNTSELASAEQEYKAAVAGPEPAAQDYYRLGEVYARENKLDDSIAAFTKASQLGQGTLVQKYADGMAQRLKEQKAKSQPAPAPTAQ